jgi:uncharacterized protein (DUF1330 family)
MELMPSHLTIKPPNHIVKVRKVICQMLLFVQFDLSNTDLRLFEAYEAKVLAMLDDHGAKLEARVRSKDGHSEFHLLEFPHPTSLEAFRADPRRIAVQEMWESCGATSVRIEVERVD